MNIIVILSEYSALAVVKEAQPVDAPVVFLEDGRTILTLEDGVTPLDLEEV